MSRAVETYEIHGQTMTAADVTRELRAVTADDDAEMLAVIESAEGGDTEALTECVSVYRSAVAS